MRRSTKPTSAASIECSRKWAARLSSSSSPTIAARWKWVPCSTASPCRSRAFPSSFPSSGRKPLRARSKRLPARPDAYRLSRPRAGNSSLRSVRLLQILFVPRENAIQDVRIVLFFPWAVRLARIFDEFRFHSVMFQSAIELLALSEWISCVGLTLKDQRRRLRVLHEHERRMLQKSLRLFVRLAPEPFVIRRSALRSEFADQVGHARAGNSRLEARRLRDRPLRHVPSVRPAADAEPVGVRDAARDQRIDPGHHVLIIGAAPIRAIHFHELFSIADRAANVRIENRVAVPDQHLSPRLHRV